MPRRKGASLVTAVIVPLCLTFLLGACGSDESDDSTLTSEPPEVTEGFSCPVGSPPGVPVAQGLLTNLTAALNSNWPTAATQAIDPVPTDKTTQDGINDPPQLGSDACFAGDVWEFQTAQQYCELEHGMDCDEVYANVHLDSLAGLSRLQFTLVPPSTVNPKNVAAHSNRGPDASKLTDGVFAPEKHSATDPAYAIVLPHAPQSAGALVIDLGAPMLICGNGYQCIGEPEIQADNDDVYQLEYYDGANWIKYGQFPIVSGSGLMTRDFKCSTRPNPSQPCSSTNHGANFTAQYVRVFGVSGGPTYAVSELKLWNTASQVISVGKSAVGPRPYQITDGLVPDGSSATNTQYAVVLTHETGSVPALAIDLGEVTTICGNGYQCVGEPTIQADNDDVYQLDYSTDGVNWITYKGTFPSVASGSSGLYKRNMHCSARPDPDSPCSNTNHGPNFEARYVRVYAVSGGPTFAVSELQLWDAGSQLVSGGALTSGPEPLVTNGEFAPSGTSWNDGRYATILPRCNSANSVCPPPSSPPTSPALTSALLIDLTASFPIDSLTIQADRHQFQVDSSTDGTSWTPLHTFGTVGGSGLITRDSPSLGGPQARYLRVYGTAGDDNNYSVSELQVRTAQANTACAYDSAANAGESFACSFDGKSSTQVILPDGTPDARVLNVTFHVNEAELKVLCGGIPGVDPTHWTLQSATNRNCSLDLELAGETDLTSEFCGGSCASGGNLLSLYANTEDLEFTAVPGSLVCDGGNMDDKIPELLEGFVAEVAAEAAQSLLAGILDYRNKPNSLVPFPPQPGMCAAP